MKKKIIFIILLITNSFQNCARNQNDTGVQNANRYIDGIKRGTVFNYKPPNGVVQDEQTAKKIAVAVWVPIYGGKNIKTQKPYKAYLVDSIWVVTGSLPLGYHGGTAIIAISKNDGRILNIGHSK